MGVDGFYLADPERWLNRHGPKRCPFPEPRRSLYRLYWPVSVLQSWRDDYARVVGPGAAEQVLA